MLSKREVVGAGEETLFLFLCFYGVTMGGLWIVLPQSKGKRKTNLLLSMKRAWVWMDLQYTSQRATQR